MSVPSSLLRPRDGDALRAEIRHLMGLIGVPVLFGGEVQAGTLLLTEFAGVRTNGLRGLSVRRASGLGGRVVESRRPASVSDYRNAISITHHYDAPVLGEGISSVVAVPVVVDGRSRAVLYAATRGSDPIAGRAVESLRRAGHRLASEIMIRDEVDRRLRLLETVVPAAPVGGALAEEFRGVAAELRSLAEAAGDEQMRGALRAVGDKLTRALSGPATQGAAQLSPREIDVLLQVALGCSNQLTAQRLSVSPETVKSYLRSAMHKLDVHSRQAAVVAARRLGLIP